MTSHRKITFDELAKAQEIIKNGFESGVVTRYEIATIAKYYFSIGITGAKLKKELIDFCKKYSVGFNQITYRDMINNAIKIAEKYNLKTCDKVIITESEMNKIRNLPYKYAKILFVMAAISKNLKQNKTLKNQKKETDKYYCNHSLREIVGIAKISMSNDEIKAMKHFLDAECGYISATEVSVKSWEICIIDNNSIPEIIIEDMNRLYDYLPKFCERCKKTLFDFVKGQKYCSDCKIIANQEKTKQRMRDKRDKMFDS